MHHILLTYLYGLMDLRSYISNWPVGAYVIRFTTGVDKQMAAHLAASMLCTRCSIMVLWCYGLESRRYLAYIPGSAASSLLA